MVFVAQDQLSRTDLLPRRQRIYDQQGNVATDAHYHDYKDYAGIAFPNTIEIERPAVYDIILSMVKLEINRALTDDQFALDQPPVDGVQHLDRRAGQSCLPATSRRAAAAARRPWGCTPSAPAWLGTLHASAYRRGPGGSSPVPSP